MNPIKRVDTVELLKKFWEWTADDPPHSINDKEDYIAGFIKKEFPQIENPLKDIWNMAIINKYD